MTNHEHIWVHQPTADGDHTLRYRCDCGAWAWRQYRHQGGRLQLTPPKVYTELPAELWQRANVLPTAYVMPIAEGPYEYVPRTTPDLVEVMSGKRRIP